MNVRLIFGIGLVALLLAGVAVGAASFARSQQVSYSLATPAPIGRASPPPPPTMPPTAPPTDAPQVNVAAAGGGIAQSPVPSATATPEPTGVVASASGALTAGEQATAQPSASPVPTGAVAEGGGGVVTERQPSAATADPARDSAAPFALSNATDAHAQGASNQAATQPSSQPRPSVSFIDGLPPIVWATLALALLALVGGGMLQRSRWGRRVRQLRHLPQRRQPNGGRRWRSCPACAYRSPGGRLPRARNAPEPRPGRLRRLHQQALERRSPLIWARATCAASSMMTRPRPQQRLIWSGIAPASRRPARRVRPSALATSASTCRS